jgi:cholesterol oxidase
MKQLYDAVVIGSGFGGAITACRLAQAGQAVCVLEKGRRRQNTDFPRSPYELASRAIWNERQRQGFIEYRSFQHMDVIQGRGVGGGSLHYFNVNKQPPAAIFEQPRWPRSITLERMAPYYRVSREMLSAKPLEPPEGRQLPLRTQAFFEAVKAYNAQPEYLDIAVYTDSAARGSQNACIYCGSCLLGCQVNAKNTLDLNYLALAEQHQAEVYPLHSAEYIEPDGRGSKVPVIRSNPDNVRATETVTVAARTVIVAAGTLGSNELLLKCRDVYKTLPALSRALGKGFSGNGDFLLAGTLYDDKIIDPSSGPSITAGAGFASEGQYIYIEDLGFPDPLLWYINGSIPTRQRWRQVVLFAWNYVLSTLGLSDKTRMDVEFDRLFRGGATTRFLPYLGMGTDAADGVLTLDRDNDVVVNWNHAESKRLFDQMENHLRQISRASGGKYVGSFLWDWPFRKLLTAHPLGGCAMSKGPEEGVVDELGQVWNYPNLYVSDGSIIPTALAVNPSATIGAMAERVAFHMIHGREMGPTDVGVLLPANTSPAKSFGTAVK